MRALSLSLHRRGHCIHCLFVVFVDARYPLPLDSAATSRQIVHDDAVGFLILSFIYFEINKAGGCQ